MFVAHRTQPPLGAVPDQVLAAAAAERVRTASSGLRCATAMASAEEATTAVDLFFPADLRSRMVARHGLGDRVPTHWPLPLVADAPLRMHHAHRWQARQEYNQCPLGRTIGNASEGGGGGELSNKTLKCLCIRFASFREDDKRGNGPFSCALYRPGTVR